MHVSSPAQNQFKIFESSKENKKKFMDPVELASAFFHAGTAPVTNHQEFLLRQWALLLEREALVALAEEKQCWPQEGGSVGGLPPSAPTLDESHA